MSLIRLRQNRRKTASFVLLWLLFSGQLFCTAHALSDIEAGAGVETPSFSCCHGKAQCQPGTQAVDFSCCENPSTFCCGEAKQGNTDPGNTDFSHPVLILVALIDEQSPPSLSGHRGLPLWTEDICLRRSDPPIHLLKCVFLD